MKLHVAVLTSALVVGAVLWWRLTGHAGGQPPLPDIPLPAGTTVLKVLQPMVNLQTTRVTVARTTLPPSEVDRFYRAKLVTLGWREELRPGIPGTDRRPLYFRRGAWECTTFAFPDSSGRYTNLMVQVRPADAEARRGRVTRGTVAGRLEGFPLFPGVEGALLIEDGGGQGPATLLYETGAPLAEVADFYRRRLGGGSRPFPPLKVESEWASGAYTFRRWSVLINLCRRPGGGTSALVILNPSDVGTAEVGVEACSSGATW